MASRSRASTTFSRPPSLIRRTASSTTVSHSVPLSAPSENATPDGAAGAAAGDDGRWRRDRARADRGHPRGVAATSDDHLGHHQHAVARVVGERERAEADQPGAGQADLVADHGGPGVLRPPATASAKRSGPAVRHTAATPQPTRPSPRRTQAVTSGCAGSSDRRESREPASSARTVRTTRGAESPRGADAPRLADGPVAGVVTGGQPTGGLGARCTEARRPAYLASAVLHRLTG